MVIPVPSIEQIDQWLLDAPREGNIATYIAIRAAVWAADQELEECCKLALIDPVCGTKHQRKMLVQHMRDRRRPKPPSIKQQALNQLRYVTTDLAATGVYTNTDAIRKAISLLPD